MRSDTYIFFLVVSGLSFGAVEGGKEKPAGVLDEILKNVLEALRPSLENLNVSRQDFETGFQEFGNFKGHVKDVNIQGLENFTIAVLQTSLLNIKNLTLVEKNFSIKGKYNVNGTLAFPLSKSDIHFFGDGQMSVNFTNSSFSIKVITGMEGGKRVVKNLDMHVGLERVKVHLKNLMGGGDLEKVFNGLINDVGLTVFNYYKQPILDFIKPMVKDFITDVIQNNKTIDKQMLSSSGTIPKIPKFQNVPDIFNIKIGGSKFWKAVLALASCQYIFSIPSDNFYLSDSKKVKYEENAGVHFSPSESVELFHEEALLYQL